MSAVTDDEETIAWAPPRRRLRRLHDAVTHDLGQAIVAGRYRPGDLLEGEVVASLRLNVSRSAYREAVRTLAAKGLVESRPRSGTQVSPRSRWNLLDPDVLGWAFESEPDPAFVTQLFELRRIVEPAAAAQAAERRTAEQLAAMAAALEGMARHGLSVQAGQMADRVFHDLVLVATGNDLLVALSSSIGAAVRWTTVYKQRLRALPRDPLPEHRAVFDAIALRDPTQARVAMAELIGLALEDTRTAMDSSGA